MQAENFNQNNIQWMTRVDYSISDNTKLFVRYNLQRETQLFPVGLWWRQGDQVPYPTPVLGKNKSDSVTASLTHVFSPTMTNEFVFGYTYIGFPNVFSDPSKVDRTKVGYNYKGLFKNGVTQIPSFGGNGGNYGSCAGVQSGRIRSRRPAQGLYADKYMPSSATPSPRCGARTRSRPASSGNGSAMPSPPTTTPTGMPQVQQPRQLQSAWQCVCRPGDRQLSTATTRQFFNRINDIAYNTYEGFVQDSWKVTRRLTLELGIRITHFQPWDDRLGYGYSIFDYFRSTVRAARRPHYCGFEWHKRDPGVPLAGFPTRAHFYQPRFGLAYDVFGQGQDRLRGGWGRYYYHSGQFTSGLNAAQGNAGTSISQSTEGGTPIYSVGFGFRHRSASRQPARRP